MRRRPFLLLFLTACAGENTITTATSSGRGEGEQATSADGSASRPPSTPARAGSFDRAAVRVDPITFEETRLGVLRVDGKPPFRAEAVGKDPRLATLVEQMNAVDHVMSAGLSTSPPQRVERSSDEFFRIMQYGWLAKTHFVELRLPGKAGAARRRFDAVVEDGGKPLVLGRVEVDDMSYLSIASGPSEHRARLGKILRELNGRVGESVDIPPPAGERGKHGRAIPRGSAEHWPMLRDELYDLGAILVPEGRKHPEAVRVDGARSHHGSRWLSVHAPTSLMAVPTSGDAVLELAGPPGGPLGFRASMYRGLKHDAAALEAHVASRYGKAAGYVAAKAAEVDVASRRLLAVPFRTGDGPATAQRLLVLWPAVYHLRDGEAPRDLGVALELTASGAGAPDPKWTLEHPTLAWLLDSLFVDLERGDVR